MVGRWGFHIPSSLRMAACELPKIDSNVTYLGFSQSLSLSPRRRTDPAPDAFEPKPQESLPEAPKLVPPQPPNHNARARQPKNLPPTPSRSAPRLRQAVGQM